MEATRKRIFIIDDDPDDKDFLTESINASGLVSEIISFADGRKFLEHLANHRHSSYDPDLVFLDINMPILNGVETLRAMREYGYIINAPIIIFSTNISPYNKQQLTELGAIACYTKPYTANLYTELVNEIFHNHLA